ncbi:MAG: OmpA family protein, partial [Bacteroidota bacterium]
VMIFVAEKDEKDGWSRGKVLGKELNRPGLTSANPAISADGRRMIFNRMRVETNVISEAKLYVADIDEDGWKSANPIAGLNSNDYLVLQPAVGELYGREVLFFVSDMDGGFGGMDIYYANHEGDGRYGAPVNLGPTINTFADDKTPFYFDGTLYFSTDGRPTMGGYDLFYSAWNGSEWSAPENMGTGFNSTVDDKSLSVFGDGLVGFMTSNREGGRSVRSKTCCDDIYGFQIASLYANLVVGLFSEDKQPLKQGTIELQPIVQGSAEGLGEQKTRDDGNRFDFGLALESEYQIVASHPGYFPDSVEMNTLGLEESKEFQQVFFLKKMPEPEVEVPVYDTIAIEEAITLENILYDFNDDKILPAAENDLREVQKLMEQYPDMVIELGSHTDSRGEVAYNQNLSKRRAASARKWLIVNGGIAGPRIKTKGYGKTVPQTVSPRLAERVGFLNQGDVLTDTYINALPDKETQERAHDFNRRTEFKIIDGPTTIVIRRD